MPLTPKIPTFEELLEEVKAPKVPTVKATGDLLDSDSASRLGYKIPSEWKVGQDITGTSLISPRGNIFKDIKLSPEGRIEDFKPFSAEGEPIKLPPTIKKPEMSEQFLYEEWKRGVPISETKAKIGAMPPIEPPPPVEPLGDEIPGDLPPKGPLRDLFIQRLKAPLPEGQVDIERALRSERGISIREWEALGLTTKEQRRSILKPGEEILFPLQSTTEGLQRVKIIGGEKPLKELTDVEFWEKVSETISALPGQTIFTIAGIPISAGTVTAAVLIAFGIYEVGNAGWNVLLDKVLKKPGDLNFLGRQLTRAGLNRNLNILERQRGVKIPAETRKSFINKYLSDMASSWERNVAGQGKAVNVKALQIASQNTYTQTANAVNREIQALIPKATQTGAMAFGGVPEVTVQSVVAKIVSNQALTAAERQLYANQSQAIEAALKAQQVTPTPTTEAVVTPPAVTPPVTEAVGNFNKGAMVQFQPEGRMYEVVSKTRTRVTLKDGEGNQSSIPISQQIYPLEPTTSKPSVTPEVTPPVTPEVTIGDTISDGLVSGKVVGEGIVGKNIPAYRIELPNGKTDLIVKDQVTKVTPAIPKAEVEVAKPPAEVAPEAPQAITRPVKEEVSAIPPTEPQKATQEVKAIQEQGRVAPESVPPESAETSHIELVAPDGPKPPSPPKPPTAKRDADDIFKEITEKGYNERVDQTLLRLHEATIGNETRRTALSIKAGGKKLKEQGIGVWRRDHLIPRPKDIEKLDELYIALHNPSGVASGEVKVPAGFEGVYEELRGLADWETSALLDFDPNAATIDDWFFRGWKPPTDMFTGTGARLGIKPKALRTPRVDATYQELRDAGFEPLFWNPYEQWGYRHNLGIKYREQMDLVKNLKGIGEDLIRPHDGGPIPLGWKVPEIGPAFEGKPFAIKDPDTGELGVMFTRRWITEGKIANSLENIYGKKPNLGRFVIKGKEIDPMAIIDALVFIPKRAKLFLSFFQQVDFLTRAGAGSWTQAVDSLLAGKPIEAVKAVAKYPVTFAKVLQANFRPKARLKLSQQMDSTVPIVQGRPGINLKGISEAGLSTRDVTIFPADMDKLVREVANETGILAKGKRFAGMVGDLESAMRRGLFDGVYPAAIITDIQNNIASMVARQHPSLNDAQINSIIARIANIKYSTIPASQSVIQNRMLRETLRRVFFSVGESEGLLRQATNVFHGPNKRFWGKHFIGVYLFLITTAMIIHYASTGEPLPADRYSPISKDNWGPLPFGYNTKFAAPTLPIKGRGDVELTLDLAGQMDTAFRVLDPINFLTSRESVPVRAAWNQISGEDFYGAPIDDVGPGGVISRTSQLMHDLFAPIGLGGITGEAARQFIPGVTEIVPRAEDRLGLAGQAIQATGMNVRAETTMDLLNRYAKESGFNKADGTPVEEWDDLEPYQKKELSKNAELETELGLRSEAAVERQQLGAVGFATLDTIDKERVVRGEGLVSTLFRDLEVEDADRSNLASNFRSNATDLKREISIRKAQVDEDFQLFKDTGKLEKDPDKRALTEYYNTYDLATNKVTKIIDWDKQDKLELALRKKWTGSQEAYVDRNIGLTEWGPLFDDYEIQRRTLGDSGYWDLPGSGGYLSLSKSAVDDGKLPEKYRQIWESYQKVKANTTRRAAYRKRYKHLTVNLREKFRKDNPEIEAILTGKFYGYAPLEEQEVSIRRTRAGATRIKLAGAGGGFGGATVSPRRAAPTYPKFPTPRISTGISVKAPSVPGF